VPSHDFCLLCQTKCTCVSHFKSITDYMGTGLPCIRLSSAVISILEFFRSLCITASLLPHPLFSRSLRTMSENESDLSPNTGRGTYSLPQRRRAALQQIDEASFKYVGIRILLSSSKLFVLHSVASTLRCAWLRVLGSSPMRMVCC